MTNTHTNESGRSMIEMLGVLAIIGVLSVGGIAGYSQAMSKFKVSKTTDQVQTMVTNVRTLFAGQRSYDGLSKADGDYTTAYTMGILTDETWDKTNKKATNPYGGSILLGTPNSNHYFSITYNGLSADACTRLVMADWGDASSGLVGLIVAGTAQSAAPTDDQAKSPTFATAKAGADGGFPVELTKAVEKCQGTTDNDSSITWIYR